MATFPVADRDLRRTLCDAAAITFAGVGGSGYARCDFRVDNAGVPHLLEINPNCGIFYPDGAFGGADHVLAVDPGGPARFLEHLLRCGLRRHHRDRPAWEISFDREVGF